MVIKGSDLIKELRAKDERRATRERNTWALICVMAIAVMSSLFLVVFGLLTSVMDPFWSLPIAVVVTLVPFYFLVKFLSWK